MYRDRQIKTMPSEDGKPCDGETIDVKECRRNCKSDVFCQWSDWEDEDDCSVTCGEGIVKRVRNLKVFPADGANDIESKAALPQHLDVEDNDDEGSIRELVLSFVCGGSVSLGVLMVALAINRRGRESRVDPYGEGHEGYQAQNMFTGFD